MSVTSMNSRMAMAEKLSIPQLQQAIKAGSVPAYVGIPLLQEKMKLQRAMQAQMGQEPQPEGTIADQIMQEADAEGITRLPSNLPLYDVEDMQGAEYARGGIVALAEGEEVEDPYAYTAEGAGDAPATTTTVSSGQPTLASRLPVAEISPETQALFKEYGDQIRAQRANAPKEREQALYMAMIQGGLAAAGGASPNALQNIAQGATAGFQNYQKAMQDIKKDDRDALKQLLNMGLSKEKFLQEAQKMGVDMYKADRAFDAHKYSADMSYAAARVRASAEKQPRAPTATDVALDYIAGKTEDYVAQGVERSKAKILAQEDYYAQSRPMQPSAGVAPAIVAAEKEDPVLANLNIQLLRARNDPAKQEEITKKIDERKAVIAQTVTAQGTPGRGVGGTGDAAPKAVPVPGAEAAPARQPLPMPKSAADAKVGEVYATARGPAKWDGKQFIPVK